MKLILAIATLALVGQCTFALKFISDNKREALDTIRRVLPLLETKATARYGELEPIRHVFDYDARDWETMYNYFSRWDQHHFESIRERFPRIYCLGLSLTATYPYMFHMHVPYGEDPFAASLMQMYTHYRSQLLDEGDNFELISDKPTYEFVKASVCEFVPFTEELLRDAGKENDKIARDRYGAFVGETEALAHIEQRSIYEGNVPVILLNPRLPVKKKYKTEEELAKLKEKFSELLEPIKSRIQCPPPPTPEGEPEADNSLALVPAFTYGEDTW